MPAIQPGFVARARTTRAISSASARARGASGRIDWTAEREWRVPKSLDLSDLPAAAVCVFVDSPHEAAIVSAECPWNVVTVPE